MAMLPSRRGGCPTTPKNSPLPLGRGMKVRGTSSCHPPQVRYGRHQAFGTPASGGGSEKRRLKIREEYRQADFVRSRQVRRHSKKLQMQGARILRNEAYIDVRRNDER